MATVKITKLVAAVNHRLDTKSSVKKWLTTFNVTIDGDHKMIVGTGTLPGKWTPDNVLKEFKKNPGRFQVVPKNLDIAKATGLLAA